MSLTRFELGIVSADRTIVDFLAEVKGIPYLIMWVSDFDGVIEQCTARGGSVLPDSSA